MRVVKRRGLGAPRVVKTRTLTVVPPGRGADGVIAAALLAALALACDGDPVPPESHVASVEVIPPRADLFVGDSLLFDVVARDANERPVSTAGVVWRSDAPGVASVADDGLVRAIAPGTASIRATLGEIAGAAPVTVSAVPTLAIEPPDAEVATECTVAFRALLEGSERADVRWTSSDTAVARVGASGLATGRAPGTALVGAALTDELRIQGVATLRVHTRTPATMSLQGITRATGEPVAPGDSVSGVVQIAVAVDGGDPCLRTISIVELTLDGAPVAEEGYDQGAQVITFELDTTSFANGPHDLRVRAIGPDGAVAISTPDVRLVFQN